MYLYTDTHTNCPLTAAQVWQQLNQLYIPLFIYFSPCTESSNPDSEMTVLAQFPVSKEITKTVLVSLVPTALKIAVLSSNL